MAKNFINNSQLILRKDRQEIQNLLGPPEQYSDVKNNEFYYMTREEWDWIDPSLTEHLVISFDANGRAVKVRMEVWRR